MKKWLGLVFALLLLMVVAGAQARIGSLESGSADLSVNTPAIPVDGGYILEGPAKARALDYVLEPPAKARALDVGAGYILEQPAKARALGYVLEQPAKARALDVGAGYVLEQPAKARALDLGTDGR